MVDLLVDHGADPEWEDTHQLRPLHWCAIRSDIGAMLALIRRGAAVNPHCRIQKPLHDAASRNLLTVALLLDHGADPRTRDDEDNTPLHCAAAAGKTDVVRFLLQRAGESIRDTNVRGETALHLAADEGKLDVVQLLVEMWPDGRRLKTGRGNTPLHLAVASVGSFEGLELLSDSCQEVVREKNDFGNSPVDLAIMFGNQDSNWWDQL
jgi:ankyrin repeat protein